VDAPGDLLLVPKRLLVDLHGRSELLRRRLHRTQLHVRAPLQEVVEEPHGVLLLLAGLAAHPPGETVEVLLGEVGRHGEVYVGRIELEPDLIVDGLLDGCVHRILPRWLLSTVVRVKEIYSARPFR